MIPSAPCSIRRDALVVAFFVLVCTALLFLPTGFEERSQGGDAERIRGRIIHVDDTHVQRFGILRQGEQLVIVEALEGRFKGQQFRAQNILQGRMDLDKLYQPGDTALLVLTINGEGEVIFVNPQDHYRLGLEFLLLGLFAVLLLAYGRWTGLKALLSFVLTALMLWKVLVPRLLAGWDPFWLSIAVVTFLTISIITLVAGLTRKALVALLGSLLGILCSAALAYYFTLQFRVHGAVLPFAETMLYSGFGHLDLVKLFVGSVFIAASGAVMDLSMDVAAAMDEVVCSKPDITRREALRSGLNVGRAVVGTMTTTLLLAYSGGYITLLMAFMAQGVPLTNQFNLLYVSAEVLKTLVGSFGLVTVAPFTAAIGALLFVRHAPACATPER
ncbi:YibE/F family protein [Megalodesulfovibrio gigas]|uniref:Putative YibE/F family protein n=1 Tax=Megalodesulfovibrio gigas (strain ATCC 19364 / DSM 1382 / NCIMB 9332 / VKM B-1759) TaxID=1121448 RepID=T2GC68_MEGG1|nr:YibE/F family protein [Megalodesulfovibrio gigas]AGW13898.1 putative YibE/F family protein [Megalodesulfovibrio gigas DSM 1382 = ATCC 19364]